MTSALLLSALLAGPVRAGDPDTPHGHRGHLAPYTSKPAALVLTDADTEKLLAGDPVVRSERGDGGGTGTAVMFVHAPASTVWDVILDYPRYPERVKSVVSSQVYRREGDVWYVDMQSRILGFPNTIYSRNTIRRDEGWMAWTLDYDRTSDVGDMVGYWRVEQIQDSPPLTRVDQSSSIEISGIPGFVASYLTRQALVDNTGWVKQTAEALAR